MGVGVYSRWHSSDSGSVAERLEACVQGSPTSPPTCLHHEFDASARRGDVVATLVALQDLQHRGLIDDCHLLAHRLAHAVYRVVGDVERTFLLGGPQCRLGYLHGAVEASGASPTRRVPVPRCDRFAVGEQQLACAHGYGHAVMQRTHHDLLASISACRRAKTIDGDACILGVMMENSLRFSGQADFAEASARGCAHVRASAELTRLCFDNIGVVAALSVAHDPARAAPSCRRLTTRSARAACLDGMRDEIAEVRRSGK